MDNIKKILVDGVEVDSTQVQVFWEDSTGKLQTGTIQDYGSDMWGDGAAVEEAGASF